MIKSTEYLYNCSPQEFIALPYKQALEYKFNKAQMLLFELMEVHYSQRDDERVKHVFNAVKFNQKLLEELNE